MTSTNPIAAITKPITPPICLLLSGGSIGSGVGIAVLDDDGSAVSVDALVPAGTLVTVAALVGVAEMRVAEAVRAVAGDPVPVGRVEREEAGRMSNFCPTWITTEAVGMPLSWRISLTVTP